MKKVILIFIGLLSLTACANAQQTPQMQRVNASQFTLIQTKLVVTAFGTDTVNAITPYIPNVVSVTDSFTVKVNYYLIKGDKGIQVAPLNLGSVVTLPLAPYQSIAPGKTRYNAIISSVLANLGLTPNP